MLAPPDEQLGSDKGALEGAGKERYLRSLEHRLDKLQGANKKQLTSKDILQSLSEAKDDHMQQFMNSGTTRNDPWGGGGGASGRTGSNSTGRDSPFSVRNEFAEVDLGAEDRGSGGGERGGEGGGGRGRGGSRVLEREEELGGEDRPVDGIWSCCLCFKGRHQYSRARLRRGEEEEQSRLVDCDELSLEWQREDINDIT